jgi:hypothetical protein
LSGLAAFCSAAALLLLSLNPYQGSFLTARMLRKKITADLLAADADLSEKKLTPRGCLIFMNDAKNH